MSSIPSESALEIGADQEFIRQAVNEANVIALRLALYHQTKDESLAAMEVQEWPIRGGALTVHAVPKQYHQEIKDKAFEYLISNPTPVPPPTRVEVAKLIRLYNGQAPSKKQLDYGYEELAFEEFPRDVSWNQDVPFEALVDFKVTIIGSGFSGIAAAIYLQRLGIDFEIIERHSDLGGTWLINNYLEARVDVSTFLYQYKFEKNYPWKSYYAPREELKEYTNYIVDKYGLQEKIVFNTSLQAASWDAEQAQWNLQLKRSDGSIEAKRCSAIISASGLFNTPKKPNILGLEKFKGRMFHTTEWDHSIDFSDKRVGQIGTGSTGIQLARGLAQNAKHLTVFQRTASWVTPVAGYHATLSEHKRWMLDHMPGYNNWFVFMNYYGELQMQKFQEVDQDWVARGGRVNQQNAEFREGLIEFIKSKLGDRQDLIEKSIPNVVPMARRMVIDNQWYETILRDNVSLHTDGIKEITERGVIDQEGVEHQFDVLVLSSGFDTSQYVLPTKYRGVDGAKLEDLWAIDGARAFKGMTVPGFPNFFMMYGPNGQARIGSFHSWAENFSRYICGLLVNTLEQGGKSVVVKREAFEKYNSDMDQAMKGLLWETETGDSYYVNQHGRSGVNMPWDVHEFYSMIQRPDLENYEIQ